MIFAAELNEHNVVLNTAVFSDESDVPAGWIAYTADNPASIGGDYVEGFFYSEQPFGSWLRSDGVWLAPVPYPTDGGFYRWDEDSLAWVVVE